MITPKQNRFYWSLWAKAKAVLMRGRETWTGDEENKLRHELHVRAIGRDKSHYDLTNRELDLVLREFRVIIDPLGVGGTRPGYASRDSSPAIAQRRRLYFALRGVMRRLRVSEEYVNAVSRHMFMGLEIGDLGSDELQKIIIALRAHERRQAA